MECNDENTKCGNEDYLPTSSTYYLHNRYMYLVVVPTYICKTILNEGWHDATASPPLLSSFDNNFSFLTGDDATNSSIDYEYFQPKGIDETYS